MRAAGDHGAMARDVAGLGLDADQRASWAVLADLRDGAPADKFAFVQLHRPAQTRFVRVDTLVHGVPVQAQRSFEARRGSGAEAGRKHRMRPALLEDRVPNLSHAILEQEDLETVLT